MTRWLDRLLGRGTAESFQVRGFDVTVVNSRPDIETAFVLARFDAALGLIEQYQPWRFRHLRRDITQFRIIAYPCRGAYFPAERVIMTELSFLGRAAEFTPAVVASSILHEGVHARTHRMRSRLRLVASPHDAAREERLCRKAELAFGQALPPELGAPVMRRAAESLALTDAEVAPVIDWNAARAAKARADQAAITAWSKKS